MKGYLFDSNIAIICLRSPERIPPRVRALLETNRRFLSVISYWEITLKVRKGRLDVGDTRMWWSQALATLGARAMPLIPDHIDVLLALPAVHQDRSTAFWWHRPSRRISPL